MTSINKSKANLELGHLGEDVVARWLQQQGFEIIARRWHCLWGEIDIVALLPHQTASSPGKLIFVEVKTRSLRNWDTGGLLAISQVKQAKIRQSAAFFLAENSNLADCDCQFDVALVSYDKCRNGRLSTIESDCIAIGEPIFLSNGTLCLQDYLESAFD